jgi:hypothetical protein
MKRNEKVAGGQGGQGGRMIVVAPENKSKYLGLSHSHRATAHIASKQQAKGQILLHQPVR